MADRALLAAAQSGQAPLAAGFASNDQLTNDDWDAALDAAMLHSQATFDAFSDADKLRSGGVFDILKLSMLDWFKIQAGYKNEKFLKVLPSLGPKGSASSGIRAFATALLGVSYGGDSIASTGATALTEVKFKTAIVPDANKNFATVDRAKALILDGKVSLANVYAKQDFASRSIYGLGDITISPQWVTSGRIRKKEKTVKGMIVINGTPLRVKREIVLSDGIIIVVDQWPNLPLLPVTLPSPPNKGGYSSELGYAPPYTPPPGIGTYSAAGADEGFLQSELNVIPFGRGNTRKLLNDLAKPGADEDAFVDGIIAEYNANKLNQKFYEHRVTEYLAKKKGVKYAHVRQKLAENNFGVKSGMSAEIFGISGAGLEAAFDAEVAALAGTCADLPFKNIENQFDHPTAAPHDFSALRYYTSEEVAHRYLADGNVDRLVDDLAHLETPKGDEIRNIEAHLRSNGGIRGIVGSSKVDLLAYQLYRVSSYAHSINDHVRGEQFMSVATQLLGLGGTKSLAAEEAVGKTAGKTAGPERSAGPSPAKHIQSAIAAICASYNADEIAQICTTTAETLATCDFSGVTTDAWYSTLAPIRDHLDANDLDDAADEFSLLEGAL